MRERLQKTALRVVGMRQVLRAVKEKKAVKVYLAQDASEDMKSQVLSCAEENGVPVAMVSTMRALSHLCNVDVPTSAAAVLKDTAS